MAKHAYSIAIALSFLGLAGCSTTTRSLTATAWIAPPSAGPAPAEGAAPAKPGIASQYYLTYWEGSCRSMMGCSRGDTKVKRCQVQGDNTVTCVDEPNATKALSPD